MKIHTGYTKPPYFCEEYPREYGHTAYAMYVTQNTPTLEICDRDKASVH